MIHDEWKWSFLYHNFLFYRKNPLNHDNGTCFFKHTPPLQHHWPQFDALCHTFHLFPKNAAFKHSFTTLTSLKDKFMAVWTHGSAFADVVSSTKQPPFSLLCQLMHLSSVLISMPSLFPSSLLYNCICPRLRKIKSLKKKKKKCFYSTAPVKVQQHWLF